MLVWFGEGADVPDVLEARELLAGLGAMSSPA
jgi:hypothetical protein